MMKMKKVLALGMTAMLSVGLLGGCGGESDGGGSMPNSQAANDGDSAEVTDVSLKVWVPEEEIDLVKEMEASFEEAHPEYNMTWDNAVVGIDESAANLTTDDTTAADVFELPSGSISQLTDAGLLLPIGYDIDNVKSLYSEGAIASCTKDDMVYGIPFSPNTWFMYYNKDMYTEDEVKSLETMMAKDLGTAEDGTAIANFSCTMSNSWYIEAFFYAAGCDLFGADGSDATSCSWNSADGLAAANYLIDLANNPKYVEDLDGIAGSLFSDGKLGALCSGNWSAPGLKEDLGDSLGAVALPTVEINGKTASLSPFIDYKCFAVKSSTAFPLAAQQFAEWLGNDENQLLRYQEAGASPAVLSLQDNPEVSEDIATIALLAQTETATTQPSISQIDQYWTPAQALGEGIVKTKEITKDNIQEKLDQTVQAIVTPAVE